MDIMINMNVVTTRMTLTRRVTRRKKDDVKIITLGRSHPWSPSGEHYTQIVSVSGLIDQQFYLPSNSLMHS